MENASKALIIAGSILISILLISVGLIVFNSTKGVVDQGKEASKLMEKEAFNSNFTKYCGDKVLGTNVRSLQNFVDSYNSANGAIAVTLNTPTTIYPNKYYKVYVPYSAYKDGYIVSITVEPIT